MSLTSQQKHYIKKNVKKLSPVQMASDLDLPLKKIRKYLKDHFPHNRSGEKNSTPEIFKPEISSFNFYNFFAENISIFILIFFLVFISYFNTLDNGFVSDDIPNILKNNALGDASNLFAGHFNAFVGNFINFIAYKISGTNTVPFRLFAVIFHLGAVFSAYVLLSLLFKKRIAALAATLFAVHPILAESVTWTSGNPYCRYSFFFLISFIFYLLSKNNRKYYYLSIFFFILSLLSSTSAPVAFLIFFLYEASFGSIRQFWKKLVSFVFLGATSVLFFMIKIGERTNQVEKAYSQQPESINPFLQIPVAIGSYLKLVFWPQALTLYQTEMGLTTVQYLIFLFIFIIFLGSIFYSWKKNKTIFFWLMFFVIALLPTLTPLKIAWIVAERYVYLGSIGIFVVFAMFLDWLIKRLGEKDEKYKFAIYSFFAVIILALSIRTMVRNMDWQSEDSLWIATAKTSPSGPNTHNNMGDVYSRHGDLEKAAEEFSKAIELNPLYADAYHNLGITYIKMGETSKAADALQKSLQINPDLWQSYQNLAVIYFNQGDYVKALEYSKKGLEVNPQDPTLNQNLKLIEDKLK